MAEEFRSSGDESRMHQATLRFAPELWDALSAEADLPGVSAAQFVREAVLTRIVYSAIRRGDPQFEAAMKVAGIEDAAPSTLLEDTQRAAKASARAVGDAARLWAVSRQAAAGE